VLEAFARGRPVVATDLGALPELVEGCGWVAPPTPGALAAALRAATDPNAAAAAGARARARYEERFTPTAALAALLDTYAAVVGSPVG
jgi:glycosyltransferase involved in cell wall biosynthesis